MSTKVTNTETGFGAQHGDGHHAADGSRFADGNAPIATLYGRPLGGESRSAAEFGLGCGRARQHERGGAARGDAGHAAHGEKRLADCVAAARDFVHGFDDAFGRRHRRARSEIVCESAAADSG